LFSILKFCKFDFDFDFNLDFFFTFFRDTRIYNSDVDTLGGKAKFMVDSCSIIGGENEVDIVRRNCFLTTVHAANRNADGAVLVGQSTRFQYRSFSFTESFEDTTVTLKCRVL